MTPLQNTAPYNVTPWWSRKLHKYPDYLSNSLRRKTSAGSSKPSKSQKMKIVTDQTLWCWATRLLQTESHGISDRCFTIREKSWAIFKQEASAPDPNTYTLLWKHAIWHFVVAFSHLPQPFPLKIEYLGSLLESAVRKGSPGSTTFFYLYQQHYCTSSNIFYI